MTTQEQLERLEREIRGYGIDDWADLIAAIRDGLGKAQGEAVAWLWHYADGKTKSLRWRSDQQDLNNSDVPARSEPLYLAPPTDYAQDLPYVVTPKHGEWVPCTPELLNSGVDCGSTLRRACEGGGHDHYVVADSAHVLVDAQWREQYDEMRYDYQRYQDGDTMMPFSTFRLSLALFLEETDKALAAHKSEVKG